ncbi:MAG: hypothetical protein AAF682_00250 [Planctomycetota bacterium]
MGQAKVVVGASDHYGRAELVTLTNRGGAPALLDRRRVELIDAELPVAPYHHEALEMEAEQAAELVAGVRRSVAKHAAAAIATMKAEFGADALVLPASPYDGLPDALQDVLRSRPLTNAADGMLYREALAEAAADAGLRVCRYPRKADPTTLAAKAMGVDAQRIKALIADFGGQVGPPWRKDHKLAAAAALSELATGARG